MPRPLWNTGRILVCTKLFCILWFCLDFKRPGRNKECGPVFKSKCDVKLRAWDAVAAYWELYGAAQTSLTAYSVIHSDGFCQVYRSFPSLSFSGVSLKLVRYMQLHGDALAFRGAHEGPLISTDFLMGL